MATNWAGNVTFSAPEIYQPVQVEAVQDLVSRATRIRALGTGHSFSTVADNTGDLVSLGGLPRRVEVDPALSTVTVSAGLRYGEVVTELHEQGYALRNLGSLPHIGIAGAIATGTHGSGTRNGNLSSDVAALDMVRADGELIRLSRDSGGDEFLGSVVSLGALGIVTAVTLDVIPTFDISQVVYEDLPWSYCLDNLDEVMASGYSVSLFTDWRRDVIDQVWLKRGVDTAGAAVITEPSWHGATHAPGPRHPLPGLPGTECTEQHAVVGPWHLRLPHFRLEFTPSSGEELQSEYFVDRADGPAALAAVHELRDVLASVLQVSEIRSVAADELWLSPAYRRDSLAIHFTWIKDTAVVLPMVGLVEAALAPYDPRPHWGKVFTCKPESFARTYDRYDDMRLLISRLDPTGVFRNDFLDTYLLPHSRRGSSGTS